MLTDHVLHASNNNPIFLYIGAIGLWETHTNTHQGNSVSFCRQVIIVGGRTGYFETARLLFSTETSISRRDFYLRPESSILMPRVGSSGVWWLFQYTRQCLGCKRTVVVCIVKPYYTYILSTSSFKTTTIYTAGHK